MFTGFASENTPAIQVHDFFRTFASSGAVRSVSLADDCAPIQVFRTGAAATFLSMYLPTAPIEGKQITIVNQRYGINAQSISIFSSDTSGVGASIVSPLFTLGQADSIILVYSKQNISYGTSTGIIQSGWIALNRSSPAAANYYSAIVGGDSNSASSQYCFIGGGVGNVTSGFQATVVGGSSNTASGSQSVVVNGSSSTASGSNAAIMGGFNNTASGLRSAVIGGTTNQATQQYAATIGGDTIRATNSYAFAAGGSSNTAGGQHSAIVGGAQGTTRSITGNFVIPASNTPITPAVGVQQLATLLLGRETTDATATRLASDANAAGTSNQVILPNNSAYTFQGTCIAARTAAGDTSSWKFEGAIKRGANAASTALVAAVTPTVIAQDAGASTWVLAITADTTNGGIAVTVTGQAATTIRWVAKIETTEVTF